MLTLWLGIHWLKCLSPSFKTWPCWSQIPEATRKSQPGWHHIWISKFHHHKYQPKKPLKGRYSNIRFRQGRLCTKPSRGGKSQAGRGLPHRERERERETGSGRSLSGGAVGKPAGPLSHSLFRVRVGWGRVLRGKTQRQRHKNKHWFRSRSEWELRGIERVLRKWIQAPPLTWPALVVILDKNRNKIIVEGFFQFPRLYTCEGVIISLEYLISIPCNTNLVK